MKKEFICPKCKQKILAGWAKEKIWLCYTTTCEWYGREIPEKELIVVVK